MQGCRRFRDTSVLDFSPFTSLAEFNSATVQLSTSDSRRTDSSFPPSSNKRTPGAGSLNPNFTFPSFKLKNVSRHKHSPANSSTPRKSICSNYSSSTAGGFQFEPQATSTEYRRSHRTENSQSEFEPSSEGSWSSNGSGEISPPPYSYRKSVAPPQVSHDSPQVVWDQEELEDYSNLDLENENLSSRHTQCIDLPLEDYYCGKKISYGFTRKSGKGKASRTYLKIDIPPGCQSDTVFCFSNAGHQLEDGTFQDIHLIFVERPHSLLYRRSGADLETRVRLPWCDLLKERSLRFSVCNVDGKKYSLEVDYRTNKMIAGSAVFQDAGMPRLDGNGRGTLRIEWEIAVAAPNDDSP